jgi:hypothetical protein
MVRTASSPDPRFRSRLVLGLVVAIAATVALALVGRTHGSKRVVSNASQSELVSVFQILRTHPEVLPQRANTHLTTVLGPAASDLSKGNVQRARTPYGPLWVLAGHGLVCLAQGSHGGAACAAPSAVRRRGLVLGVFVAPVGPETLPSRFLLFGLAPDWAARSKVRIGQRVHTVPVHGNTYAIRANRPIMFEGLMGIRAKTGSAGPQRFH